MPPAQPVITGIGLISPLGNDLAHFAEALKSGRSGVHAIRSFDPTGLPAHFGGEVSDFDARNFLEKKDRKALKMMSPTMQFAVGAAALAMADAGLSRGAGDPGRFGVVLGSSTISNQLADFAPAGRLCLQPEGPSIDLARWGKEGLSLIPPMWMLGVIPNIMNCHLSILHDAQGPCNTITLSDISAVLALAEASDTIRRGAADVMLVGGADARINAITMVRHALFEELSQRNDAPEKACRPFDRGRDGGVMGEGAAVFVVENAEHARKRGARIYAEVLGHGSAYDRRRDGRGLARAAELALERSGLEPADLDHVNAHGIGTRTGDIQEAAGLEPVCRAGVEVLALKGYLGNTGAASGALELAGSLLALREEVLPATLNCDDPDPECPVPVQRLPRPVRRPTVLKVALSPMGQCAAIVCRRWDEA